MKTNAQQIAALKIQLADIVSKMTPLQVADLKTYALFNTTTRKLFDVGSEKYRLARLNSLS